MHIENISVDPVKFRHSHIARRPTLSEFFGPEEQSNNNSVRRRIPLKKAFDLQSKIISQEPILEFTDPAERDSGVFAEQEHDEDWENYQPPKDPTDIAVVRVGNTFIPLVPIKSDEATTESLTIEENIPSHITIFEEKSEIIQPVTEMTTVLSSTEIPSLAPEAKEIPEIINVDFQLPDSLAHMEPWKIASFNDFYQTLATLSDINGIQIVIRGNSIYKITLIDRNKIQHSTLWSLFMKSIGSNKFETIEIENKRFTVNPIGREKVGLNMSDKEMKSFFERLKIHKIRTRIDGNDHYYENGVIHDNIGIVTFRVFTNKRTYRGSPVIVSKTDQAVSINS